MISRRQSANLTQQVPTKLTSLVQAPKMYAHTEHSYVPVVETYLLSLRSLASRHTMASILAWVARALGVNQGQKPAYAYFDWRTLDREHVQALVALKRQQGASPSTINTLLAGIRGVAKELHLRGEIDSQHWSRIQAVKRETGQRIRPPAPLNHQQIQHILADCQQEISSRGIRDAAIFAVLLGMGLRRNELVRLTRQTWAQQQHQRAYALVYGKGDKERWLPIPQDVLSCVQRWIDQCRGDQPGPLFCAIRKDDHLLREHGLTGAGVHYILRQRLAAHGLETSVHPHGLRKLYATQLRRQGVPLTSIQKLLGHASVTTTQMYVFEDEEKLLQAVDTVNLPL
ncbi:Site-specific recombinase XerD [Allopseudospirillum japonicum]|uniref:Site-specific recombinase XerD n=1 Tax=Allopseudospirillum japonicum TaxID=64971 RepID=A0A1H6Q0M0_9GAMM|nr:tyrosine-type recombinase/integrase [Allopseudospirillum japonicum]SEI37413.1 Site-specific recombinase XerD [Allopseudospirillum japonicum]